MESPAIIAVVPVRSRVPARHLALQWEAALAESDRDTVRDGVRRVHARCADGDLERTARGGGGAVGVGSVLSRDNKNPGIYSPFFF